LNGNLPRIHSPEAVRSWSISGKAQQQAFFSLHPSPTTGRRALALSPCPRHYMAETFIPVIAIINTNLADIPLLSGYSSKRWQKELNMVLQNKKGI